MSTDSTPTTQDLSPVTLTDRSSKLTAGFVPAAGMLGMSLKDDGVELLGQRKGLQNYVNNGNTMGIPLMYPYANRLTETSFELAGKTFAISSESAGARFDGHGHALHGLLAAAQGWQVTQQSEDSLTAVYDFGSKPQFLATFPFPHTVTIQVTLRDSALTYSTTVNADQGSPVPLSYGYHPYFQIPDVPRQEWLVELPKQRHLKISDQEIPTGETELWQAESAPLADRTFNHGFDQVAEGSEFVVAGGGRRIAVKFDSGFPVSQVYAPADDDSVSFEPMKAPTNSFVTGNGLVVLQPGESDTAVWSVRVSLDSSAACLLYLGRLYRRPLLITEFENSLSLRARSMAEFLGTGVLTLAIVGSGIRASQLTDDLAVQLLANTAATVGVLWVLIHLFGSISGAHFNPLITIWNAASRSRDGDLKVVFPAVCYMLAQTAGAISGVIAANLVFGESAVSFAHGNVPNGAVFLGEVVATAGLLLVVFGLIRVGRLDVLPTAVVLYVASAIWFSSSGCGANPAITVGRIFSDSFAGLAPIAAPSLLGAQLVGMVVAAVILPRVFAVDLHSDESV